MSEQKKNVLDRIWHDVIVTTNTLLFMWPRSVKRTTERVWVREKSDIIVTLSYPWIVWALCVRVCDAGVERKYSMWSLTMPEKSGYLISQENQREHTTATATVVVDDLLCGVKDNKANQYSTSNKR